MKHQALVPYPLVSLKMKYWRRFKEVFTGLGRLKVEPVKIHLTKDAKPVRRPCRRVPIAIRGKFKEELDSLCKQKVLTKLDKNEVTEWLNSFVNVDKEDTSLRVCLDPSGLNPYIIRPVFNSYTLDEISYMLKDAKVFTVCGCQQRLLSGFLYQKSPRNSLLCSLLREFMFTMFWPWAYHLLQMYLK